MKSLLSITAALFISLQLCAQNPPPATGAIYHCDKTEPELRVVIINNDHYHTHNKSRNLFYLDLGFFCATTDWHDKIIRLNICLCMRIFLSLEITKP